MNKLYNTAKQCLGLKLAPTYRELGCVEALNNVFKKATGETLIESPSTIKLYRQLQQDKRFIEVTIYNGDIGCIVISPTGYGNGKVANGHTGIVGDNGKIMSNNSETLEWDEHLTLDYWRKNWGIYGGMPVKFYRYQEPIDDEFIESKKIAILTLIVQKLRDLVNLLINSRKNRI